MTMKRILIYLAMTLPFILSGCMEMNKYLEIDSSFRAEPLLVVNGEVIADEFPRLYISKTLPVNIPYYRGKKHEAFGVQEAVVKCYINEKLVDQQTVLRERNTNPNENGGYNRNDIECLYVAKVKPQAGDHVRFEVSSRGLNPVTTEVRLPIAPKFTIEKLEKTEAPMNIFYPQKRNHRQHTVLKMRVKVEKAPENPNVSVAVGFYGISDRQRESEQYQRRQLRVADDLIFSRDAVSLSRFFNRYIFTYQDGYRHPYFSTAQMSEDSYIIALTGNIHYHHSDSKEDIKNKLVMNVMDTFYDEWAKMRYGLGDIGSGEDDETDMTEGTVSPLSEPILDITNVRGGRGIVLGYTRVEIVVVE